MATRRDVLLGLAFAPVAYGGRVFAATEEADAKPQFLFVQTSAGMQYADGVLTLTDINPITVLFSDRPERLAGHMATDDFVPFWSEGDDSFKSDPPNADLALLEDGKVENVAATFGGFLGFGSDTVLLSMEELDIIKNSEMWRAGAAVRALRPENRKK
jgi:hypothetical protein